jgi:hypothetical protein
VRGPVAQPGGHDNQQKQERDKTNSFDCGGLAAVAPMPIKTGQKKPPPTREPLSCNRSKAKPPAALTKKYPARNIFIASQPRTELLYHRNFLGRPGSQRERALSQGFDHSPVEAVERQDSEHEDGDENGQIHLLNCYQKRMKITSGAEFDWPVFDFARHS